MDWEGDIRTYKGERETVRDLRAVPGPPISMDFFFPWSEEVVTEKLRLEEPPSLAIFYFVIQKVCWNRQRLRQSRFD